MPLDDDNGGMSDAEVWDRVEAGDPYDFGPPPPRQTRKYPSYAEIMAAINGKREVEEKK